MRRLPIYLLCLSMLTGILFPCLTGCQVKESHPTAPETTPVVINELCADNKGSLVIGNERHDWIELYNKSAEAVDISGWSLSDDYDRLISYTFPAGTTIAGYGYLTVMAVGADSISSWQNVKPAAPFKLSEDGEHIFLSDNKGQIRDEIDYPAIHMKVIEITYARLTDGDEEWGEAHPTPAKTNNGSTRTLDAGIMSFSHESGFYQKEFMLDIRVPQGYTVYYTTDCRDPRSTPDAEKWSNSAPLRIYDKSVDTDIFSQIKVTDGYMYTPSDPVDKCFVVRAYVMNERKQRSRTVTKTYFIGYEEKDGYTDIPVLTLTADPYDLYDADEGLFVAEQWGHDASVNRQEIEADMTYMDENGSYVFGQKVGMRIRGTSTRGVHQKNLNIFARSRYDGNSAFIDPLFDDVGVTKSFVLRNDGMDRLTIGQGFMQELVSDREISTQDYFPVAVFLDGEYYGIYNLYERFSEDYVEAHYGVDSKDTWIVKKGGAPSSMEMNCPEAGEDYTALMHFISNVNQINDLSASEDGKRLSEWVDLKSLADILAVQLYIGNEDFSIAQNITAWRSATVDPENPYADGRWRFVIYDLDYTLECSATVKGNQVDYSYDYNPFTQPQPWAGAGFLYWCYDWNSAYPFSRNLLKNKTFSALFSDAFITLSQQEYAPKRVEAEMNRCLERLLPNMANYVSRYHSWYLYDTEPLEGDFHNNTQPNIDYFKNRPAYIIPYMQSVLGLPTAAMPIKDQNDV